MGQLFAIPAERPFLPSLALGLLQRPREQLADHLILLPSRRACIELRDTFLELSTADALLLPRLQPVGEVDLAELPLPLVAEAGEVAAADRRAAPSPAARPAGSGEGRHAGRASDPARNGLGRALGPRPDRKSRSRQPRLARSSGPGRALAGSRAVPGHSGRRLAGAARQRRRCRPGGVAKCAPGGGHRSIARRPTGRTRHRCRHHGNGAGRRRSARGGARSGAGDGCSARLRSGDRRRHLCAARTDPSLLRHSTLHATGRQRPGRCRHLARSCTGALTRRRDASC